VFWVIVQHLCPSNEHTGFCGFTLANYATKMLFFCSKTLFSVASSGWSWVTSGRVSYCIFLSIIVAEERDFCFTCVFTRLINDKHAIYHTRDAILASSDAPVDRFAPVTHTHEQAPMVLSRSVTWFGDAVCGRGSSTMRIVHF